MNLLSKDEELKLKPPLKWAGGKRWLAPLIAGYWAAHSSKRLVEPLCGGISVAMHLRPQRALLNDINIHLIKGLPGSLNNRAIHCVTMWWHFNYTSCRISVGLTTILL